uniref:RecF/RecN/SMC N-terminal domain-containing protein n=1 Tax=Odontella aurita TaxID=265563 RepID=A0A7S4JM63_9STRA
MDSFKQQWNVDLAADGGVAFVALPDTCPTCKQPIANKGEGHSHVGIKARIEGDFTAASRRINEAEAEILSAEEAHAAHREALSSSEAESAAAEARLREAELGWEECLSELESRLADARATVSRRNSELQRASRLAQVAAEAEAVEARSEAELGRLRDSADAAEAGLRALREELEELEEAVSVLEKEREGAAHRSALMSALADAFGPRGVQTYILENAVHALGFYTQSFLDELSDGAIKLDLELDAGDRIARTVAVRGADGTWQERTLSSLSGGQWRRCSLALSLGFSDLVARRGRLRPSLLVLDEPLTHLDASGRAHVGMILRKMISNQPAEYGGRLSEVSTILIILQDLAAEELEESFDSIDEVIKEKGRSIVCVEESSD